MRGILLWLGVGVLCWGQNADPLFQDREFRTRRVFSRLFGERFVSAATKARYAAVKTGNSLLLHDCGNHPEFAKSWCGDGRWALGAVLDRSPHQGLDGGAINQAIVKHLGNDPKLQAGVGRYELTAIVNRLDLARREANGEWGRGELRFIYGLVRESDGEVLDTELIVEFVQAPVSWREFRRRAGTWGQLSSIDLNGDAFAVKLGEVLADEFAQAWQEVRLRAEVRFGNNADWHFLEWRIDGALGLVEEKLGDQVHESCNSILPGPQCAKYSEYWGKVESLQPSQQAAEAVWPELRPKVVMARVAGRAIPAPKGYCNPTLHARNVIALRQCTACHGTETKTDFVHVATRKKGSRSARLSAFLTGMQTGPTPIAGLARGRPRSAWTVPVTFDVYRADANGKCLVRQERNTTREFNDLARRALFFAEVLARDENSPPNENEAKFILRHGPQFGH